MNVQFIDLENGSQFSWLSHKNCVKRKIKNGKCFTDGETQPYAAIEDMDTNEIWIISNKHLKVDIKNTVGNMKPGTKIKVNGYPDNDIFIVSCYRDGLDCRVWNTKYHISGWITRADDRECEIVE